MKQPIRKALFRPRLMLGMPRNPAIGLIAACLFLGFQHGRYILAPVVFLIGWLVLATLAKVDRRLPEIFVRSFRNSPGDHLRK